MPQRLATVKNSYLVSCIAEAVKIQVPGKRFTGLQNVLYYEHILARSAIQFTQQGDDHTAMNILTRIRRQLLSCRSHALFKLSVDSLPAVNLHDGESCAVISARNMESHRQLCSELLGLNDGNQSYLDDVRRNRMQCVTISSGGRIVHYGFLYHKNRTACLLGLPESAALIGNSYTTPSYRGNGCQGRSVLLRAELARDSGFSSIYAETALDNASSQRGLAKAGMRHLGKVELVIVFRFLVIRRHRPEEFRRIDFCP